MRIKKSHEQQSRRLLSVAHTPHKSEHTCLRLSVWHDSLKAGMATRKQRTWFKLLWDFALTTRPQVSVLWVALLPPEEKDKWLLRNMRWDTSLSKVHLDTCALIPFWLTTTTCGAAFPVSGRTVTMHPWPKTSLHLFNSPLLWQKDPHAWPNKCMEVPKITGIYTLKDKLSPPRKVSLSTNEPLKDFCWEQFSRNEKERFQEYWWQTQKQTLWIFVGALCFLSPIGKLSPNFIHKSWKKT